MTVFKRMLIMRKSLALAFAATSALAASAPALADSKSAAAFVLETCLAAMDDLAKVELVARENNWTAKSSANAAATSKFIKSRSMWEVANGEDRFTVMIWTMLLGESVAPLNVCMVMFPGKNVNREEFFNLISASAELTFMSDTRFPQKRGEMYEIKSDRPNKLVLNMMSQTDGTLIHSMI
jgi:hypothetical protein